MGLRGWKYRFAKLQNVLPSGTEICERRDTISTSVDRRKVESLPLDFFVREDAVAQDRRNIVQMRDVVEVPGAASRHLECTSPRSEQPIRCSMECRARSCPRISPS